MAVEERCELTDLLVDACAHCRAKADPKRSGAAKVTDPGITAGFASDCGTCSTRIVPGDRIRELPTGEWEHTWHR